MTLLEQCQHVILDRDGVLNEEAPSSGYVLRPQDFHWLPGSLEALALLRRTGVRISVATNQSAVGRGLMTLENLEAVHARMRADAAARGGALDAIFFCPHEPAQECSCRKPAPGLILAALNAAEPVISAANTLVVGDDTRDLEAAARAGVRAVLVRTGKGRRTELQLGEGNAVPAYDNLLALARAIASGAGISLSAP